MNCSSSETLLRYLQHRDGKKIVEHQDESGTTEPWSSVTRLSARFKLPLESAGTDVDAVQSEFKEMVHHSIFFHINHGVSSSLVASFPLCLFK